MSSETLRIAVVSTPRSGNTWLRRLLAQVLDLVEHAVHLPTDVNWQSLPERTILQIHWQPDEAFLALLKQHEFRTIVLARHPLDLLISILVFSQHDKTSRQWLGGAEGNEQSLADATPSSDAFRTYATSARAKALLSVSAAWWQRTDVCRVRYEDLVRDTGGQIANLLRTLGVSARKPPEEVIAAATPKHMQSMSVHHLYHVWHAQPGAWRRMLTTADANRICAAHQDALDALGYACIPDDSLQPSDAMLAWDRIGAAAMQRTLVGVKGILAETELRHQQEYVEQRTGVAALATQLQQLRELHDAAQATTARQRAEMELLIGQMQQARDQDLSRHRAELDALKNQLADLPHEQIRRLGELGPWSLDMAHRLQRWSRRFPRVATGFKSFVRFWRGVRLRVTGATMDD